MRLVLCLTLLLPCAFARGADEKIRGILEKTVRPGASAQISDALGDIYLIAKSDETEKTIAPYVGKNQRVVISGRVEVREGDGALLFHLKNVEPWQPRPSSTEKTPPPPEPKK